MIPHGSLLITLYLIISQDLSCNLLLNASKPQEVNTLLDTVENAILYRLLNAESFEPTFLKD